MRKINIIKLSMRIASDSFFAKSMKIFSLMFLLAGFYNPILIVFSILTYISYRFINH